jgi:antitoxin (DNA-binding transcriptional repressor) of toxin-antitoxin stability system
MYDIMCNIMVKATSRSVHHAFSKYLQMAHEGQQIVITKRGKPWATLTVPPAEKPRKVDWEPVFERARKLSKGRKVEAVKTLLELRDLRRQ